MFSDLLNEIMKVEKDFAGESISFTITAKMRDRWVPHFLAMLKHMEKLGGSGSSREVALYSDGDGDFRPEFHWDSSLPNEAKPVRDNDGNVLFDAG